MMRRRVGELELDGTTILSSPVLLIALAGMDELDREVFVDRVLLAEQWDSIERRLEISRGQRVYRWNRARAAVVDAVRGMADAA